jgi:murein DD-endopeptidase MepM/ murein hydrolase activator NlpD
MILSALFAAVLAVSPVQPSAPTDLRLVPPAEAVIVDRFRPPGCPFCAGNRGLEYAAPAGADVHAAAPGVVTFAGPVAGVTYVVVAHGGGYRTTYGRLDGVAVAVGTAVSTGQVLGQSGGSGIFFGLRLHDTYLDPELFFVGARPTRARLVP